MLAREPLRAAYLLHGEETFLVDRALALLGERLSAGERPASMRTLWAGEDSQRLATALDDLVSPLLFGAAQVLVVRRAEALGAKDEELVLGALPRLGPAGSLILVAGALDSRRRLLAAFTRDGAAYAFARVADPRVLREWVPRLARELGHAIRPDAIDLLVERTPADLGVLASELDKASLYAGPGVAIEAGHVEATATGGRAAAVEEVADRLARRDLAGACRALRSLLRAGEPPIRLAAFLAASLRRALHVAELRGAGLDVDATAARLGMPSWLVRRVDGSRSAAQLEQALDALRDLDVALKSSRPAAAAFEAALLRIAGPATPRRP